MATSKVHPALKAVEKNGAQKVKVAVSDIDGILRGKYLHIDKFKGAAEPYPGGGFGFATWCLAGTPLISATTTPPSQVGNMDFPMPWRVWI